VVRIETVAASCILLQNDNTFPYILLTSMDFGAALAIGSTRANDDADCMHASFELFKPKPTQKLENTDLSVLYQFRFLLRLFKSQEYSSSLVHVCFYAVSRFLVISRRVLDQTPKSVFRSYHFSRCLDPSSAATKSVFRSADDLTASVTPSAASEWKQVLARNNRTSKICTCD